MRPRRDLFNQYWVCYRQTHQVQNICRILYMQKPSVTLVLKERYTGCLLNPSTLFKTNVALLFVI
jgi:hypothetical protein